jgi:hypothetical protein
MAQNHTHIGCENTKNKGSTSPATSPTLYNRGRNLEFTKCNAERSPSRRSAHCRTDHDGRGAPCGAKNIRRSATISPLQLITEARRLVRNETAWWERGDSCSCTGWCRRRRRFGGTRNGKRKSERCSKEGRRESLNSRSGASPNLAFGCNWLVLERCNSDQFRPLL